MGATTKVLDFTDVKDRGSFNPRRKPEGDYYGHVTAVADHESKSGNDGWVFTIAVDGDARAAYPYYCNAEPKQLWKLRELFIAAGVDVPKKRLRIDPNKLVGKAIALSLEDDEYEGRAKSTVAGVFPLAELTDAKNQPGSGRKAPVDVDNEDEDDEEPKRSAPAKKATRRPAPEPEDEEDEEDDDEDDTPPPPVKRRSAKKAPEPEPEDEDEDEEDEPPAKKAPAKKAAPSRKAKAPVDDEDDDLDLDDL